MQWQANFDSVKKSLEQTKHGNDVSAAAMSTMTLIGAAGVDDPKMEAQAFFAIVMTLGNVKILVSLLGYAIIFFSDSNIEAPVIMLVSAVVRGPFKLLGVMAGNIRMISAGGVLAGRNGFMATLRAVS